MDTRHPAPCHHRPVGVRKISCAEADRRTRAQRTRHGAPRYGGTGRVTAGAASDWLYAAGLWSVPAYDGGQTVGLSRRCRRCQRALLARASGSCRAGWTAAASTVVRSAPACGARTGLDAPQPVAAVRRAVRRARYAAPPAFATVIACVAAGDCGRDGHRHTRSRRGRSARRRSPGDRARTCATGRRTRCGL